MQNLVHDIPCPEDRAVAYYLYQDYFHDSLVTDTRSQGKDWIMTLESCRDADLYYDKCKGTHEERQAQCREQAERFRYQIIFRRCKYWHDERRMSPPKYLNGRFLRSALLARIEAEEGKPHYHFRIQMCGGYIEAICEGFRIRKVQGRIRGCSGADWDYKKIG